jgi:hypothetical protein
MNRNIAFAILCAVFVVGLLAFTSPGHRLLNSVGIATACAGNDC